ncbi:7878_t:CDS:2, partial [Racocetra fulgida]
TDQFEFEVISKESPSKETSVSDEIASVAPDNINKPSENKKNYEKKRLHIDYLMELDDGGNECKVCKQIFGSQTAISTINRHFEAFHPAKFTLIKQHRYQRLDPYGPNKKYKVDSLNNKFLKWVVVDQQSFLLSENAEFIKFLQELDPRYRIGQKLLGVITNNAANMLAMGRVLKEKMNNEFSNPNVQHFHCGAHVLNIIIEEGIKSVKINSQHAVASAMKAKFTSYWAHLNELSTISGLLDPCNKLSTFDIYE